MNQDEDKLGKLINLGLQQLHSQLGYEVPLKQVFAETVLLERDEVDLSMINMDSPELLPEWVVVHMYSYQEITAYVLTNLQQDSVIAAGIVPSN